MNVDRVVLTTRASEQCLRWDCARRPMIPGSDYCGETCIEMVTFDSQSGRPFAMGNAYGSASKFAPIASKILDTLKANKETGVPQLTQDVFQIPPWESNMFNDVFDVRDDYFEWLFVGLNEIPKSTSGFEWRGGRSKMIGGEGRRGKNRVIGGEVRHCVFKPFPRQDNRWKLHQFSVPDLMGKAVYVMHCKREYHIA